MKFSVVFVLIFLVGCANTGTRQFKVPLEVVSAGVTPGKTEQVRDYGYFKMVYDSKYRLARYVSYELTAQNLRKKVAVRRDKFTPDPDLVAEGVPYVKPSEYTNSGYDRGHLAPSADFAWSQEANDKTFIMSNMAPQKGNLNRDAWRRLEDKVRRLACGEERVTVITGPILGASMRTLKSGLVVPPKFFKLVIDETPPRKAIAFIFDQEDRGDLIEQRKVDIAEFENQANIKLSEILPRAPKSLRLPASLESWKEADCTR